MPMLRQLKLSQMMDGDRNGLVSRQEFTEFMATEFDRLDVNRNGTRDVSEASALGIESPVRVGETGSR